MNKIWKKWTYRETFTTTKEIIKTKKKSLPLNKNNKKYLLGKMEKKYIFKIQLLNLMAHAVIISHRHIYTLSVWWKTYRFINGLFDLGVKSDI